MTVFQAISRITPANEAARAQAHAHWDFLAKPLGSLGLLEEQISAIAALTGSSDVSLDQPVLLVYCADHGVVAQGVSQSGPEDTSAVACALGAGESTVCHMAAVPGCCVIPVDVGILDFPGAPGVLNRRIRNATGDISQGPAMDRTECLRAVEVGMELVRQQRQNGCQILLTGEMGIGNTTASSAVVSVLLNLPPEQVTGRGAGLSDTGLLRKCCAIRQAIASNRPDPDDPIDVLTKVGGLDLAALCGTFLGGALYGVPVVMDGFISGAAALCALRLCPNARKAILPSHASSEPASRLVLDAMEMEPLLTAGMHLGEGSGAVAALSLLQQALAVYRSNHTFQHLGIDAYVPQ